MASKFRRLSLEGHTNDINSIALNASYVVSVSSDQTVKIWDRSNGNLTRTIDNGHSSSIRAVAMTSEHVCTGSDDNSIIVWKLDTFEIVQTYEVTVVAYIV